MPSLTCSNSAAVSSTGAHAELLAERPHAVAVLRERRGAVAVERVQPDQLAVGRLVQRVEREPAARVRGSPAVLAALGQRPHEPPERRAELALQRVGLAHVPGVEAAGCRAGRSPRAARRGRPRRRLELAGVAGRRAPGTRRTSTSAPVAQRDAVARGVDPLLADRLAQRRQRAPQRPARVLGILVRPQQLAQRLARARALGEREVREQRRRLAGVERHRLAVPANPRRAQQRDLQGRRHGATVTIPGRSAGKLGAVLPATPAPERMRTAMAGPSLFWGTVALAGADGRPVALGRCTPDQLIPVTVAVGYAVLARVLIARQPRNAVGWIVGAIAVVFLLGGLTDGYLASAPDERPADRLPARRLAEPVRLEPVAARAGRRSPCRSCSPTAGRRRGAGAGSRGPAPPGCCVGMVGDRPRARAAWRREPPVANPFGIDGAGALLSAAEPIGFVATAVGDASAPARR